MKIGLMSIVLTTALLACKGNSNKSESPDSNITTDTIPSTISQAIDTVSSSGKGIPDKNTAMNDYLNQYTSIKWIDSTYKDLDKLKEGQKVDIIFRFKNTGKINLVIKEVSTSCGCTIAERPEKPVAPGEEGFIKVKFDGSGHGEIRKDIFVSANTAPLILHTLVFRAEMVK